MTLTDRVVLEVPAFDTTGVFVFESEFSTDRSGSKNYLISQRGQQASAIVEAGQGVLDRAGVIDGDDDTSRRRGYSVDSGVGVDDVSIDFIYHPAEGVQWGSSASDQLTETSATGQSAEAARDILVRYLAQGRSDSQRPCQLHIGEYSDGSHGDPGAFGEPLNVGIISWNAEINATRDENEPGTIDGDIQMERISEFPNPDASVLDPVTEELRDVFEDDDGGEE